MTVERDDSTLAVWTLMSDMADAYHGAGLDLLEGAAFEIALMLSDVTAVIPPGRRDGLLGVGALLLRLVRDGEDDRAASTARMMKRLGIPPHDLHRPGAA